MMMYTLYLMGYTEILFPDDSDVVRNTVREKILNELGDKKIYISENGMAIDKGWSAILTFGIKNKKDLDLNYRINFTFMSEPSSVSFSRANSSWFEFNSNITTLKAEEATARAVRVNVPTYIDYGPYTFRLTILDEDQQSPNNIYAQEEFVINVEPKIDEEENE